jgi:hypothetical protein
VLALCLPAVAKWIERRIQPPIREPAR